MIDLSRRSFFVGVAATFVGLAAPAVIRTPGVLMPVKATPAEWWSIHYQPGTDSLVAKSPLVPDGKGAVRYMEVQIPSDRVNPALELGDRQVSDYPWNWRIERRALEKVISARLPALTA